MLQYFKSYHEKKPTILLNIYNILSLFVLIVCLLGTAFIYTFGYLKEEKQRANISLQQLEHFFVFQYRAMAEELWTGNYESISMRVSEIAKKFGDAQFMLYILDENGKCLANSATNNNFTQSCITPESVKINFNDFRKTSLQHKLIFDLSINKYRYFTTLNMEPKKLGYIYAEITDPYNFYRGTLLSKLWVSFFLKMIGMTFIWLLWLLISKKFILKPYFNALSKIEKKEALDGLAAQVAHDIQSPLAALQMIIQATSSISEDKRILIRSAVGRIRDIANNLLMTHKQSLGKANDEKYI